VSGEPGRRGTGDLDSLCGLYAVVNAIRPVLYPTNLRRSQRSALFVTGVSELQRMRQLHSSLIEGMDERSWRRMADDVVKSSLHIVGRVCRPYSTPLTLRARACRSTIPERRRSTKVRVQQPPIAGRIADSAAKVEVRELVGALESFSF
jgi:hypothetical protein